MKPKYIAGKGWIGEEPKPKDKDEHPFYCTCEECGKRTNGVVWNCDRPTA